MGIFLFLHTPCDLAVYHSDLEVFYTQTDRGGSMIDSLDVPQIFEAYRSMDLIWASKSWKKEEEEEKKRRLCSDFRETALF